MRSFQNRGDRGVPSWDCARGSDKPSTGVLQLRGYVCLPSVWSKAPTKGPILRGSVMQPEWFAVLRSCFLLVCPSNHSHSSSSCSYVAQVVDISARVSMLTKHPGLGRQEKFPKRAMAVLPARLETTRKSPAKHVSSVGSWPDLQRLVLETGRHHGVAVKEPCQMRYCGSWKVTSGGAEQEDRKSVV